MLSGYSLKQFQLSLIQQKNSSGKDLYQKVIYRPLRA